MANVRNTPNGSDDKQQKIDAALAENDWGTPAFNALAQVDPDFMDGFVQFYKACTAKNALDAKTRELIFVAIDAATTHLYNTGTLFHIKQARKQGATTEEILEVLELVTLLGGAFNVGRYTVAPAGLKRGNEQRRLGSIMDPGIAPSDSASVK